MQQLSILKLHGEAKEHLIIIWAGAHALLIRAARISCAGA